MRPTPYSKRIKSLINEEIIKYLYEYIDDDLKTDYNCNKEIIENFNADVCAFKTNSGETYDVEFIHTMIMNNSKLNDGSLICDHIKNIDCKGFTKSIDIGFTVSSRKNDDIDIDYDEYTKNTNKFEVSELMRRIAYIIKDYIKNHPDIMIYVVGLNTTLSKIKLYKLTYKNIFSNNFTLFEGNAYGYIEGAMYFVNNKLL